MRIAYDHQVFTWQKYGGISRYFYELARHIPKINDDHVNIISPLYVNEYLTLKDVAVSGLHVPQIRKTGWLYHQINFMAAPIMMCKEAPDIIHETYFSHESVAPKGTKSVITVHDMIHELFPQQFSLHDTTRLQKAAAVMRADHIICVSENTRQDLIKLLHVAPEKTSVVYHGHELLAEPAELRSSKNPYILYVGSREGYKNFDQLLLAYFSSYPLYSNFELIAFGGGTFTKRELLRIAQLSNGKGKVTQLNGDDHVLANLYASAGVFVYPSLYEGFGIPPLEAMSCGCPVICSNLSSLPEVVGNAAAFFNPELLDSLIFQMNQILFDSEYKQSLVNKGKMRCAEFSWERCARQTLSIYESLIKRT